MCVWPSAAKSVDALHEHYPTKFLFESESSSETSTRGVYQGASAVRSELAVAVAVGPVKSAGAETMTFVPWMSRAADAPFSDQAAAQSQQQQQ